jgi:histone H3/H4
MAEKRKRKTVTPQDNRFNIPIAYSSRLKANS